ncbi:MAG: hypothetical protein SVS15_08765 [Thermodesulfobacteriota bacterium]|nr:hypothetical protein [Thermodesulfobacteriota bacterium]
MRRFYEVKNLSGSNVRRSLEGAKARARNSILVLGVQVKEGVVVPEEIEDLGGGVYFEIYFEEVKDNRIEGVNTPIENEPIGVSVPLAAIEFLHVNYHEKEKAA